MSEPNIIDVSEPDTVEIEELDLYKAKYLNESAINKKTQADLALAQLRSIIGQIQDKYSNNGVFEVTAIDLDRGTVTRKAK